MLWVGREHYRSPSSPRPAVSRDINWIKLLTATSNLILNVSRDGASKTSEGNLCQCFTNLRVKNLFLV